MDNQINIKDFIGIIGTLLGVIIGGLITLFVARIQLQNQEKQRREERKIKTYEEIHKYLSILEHEAGYTFLQILGKVKQNFPIDNKERNKLPWQELEMLVNFYTPELEEDVRIIKKRWEELGRAFGLVITEKHIEQAGPNELLAQSKQFRDQIEKQVNVAKNKLSNLANKIVR
jgi:hypothetical protein